jgi:DNA polymerase-3 subunit delta
VKPYRQEADYLRLRKELKEGQLRSVYVFYGDEDFLMAEAADALRLQMAVKYGEVDASRVDGSLSPLDGVLDMVETASLFGGSRIVIVKNAPYFAKDYENKETHDRLLAHHTNQEAVSCVIFFATAFAKTTKTSKELSAAGAVYRFDQLKGAALTVWLRERLALTGKKAPAEVLTMFAERVGNDLRRLATELDKITTYLGDSEEMDEKSVLLATSRSIHGDIFALIEAVVYGKASKALTLLKDLLAAGEPPLRILAMLVRQFRLLGEACEQMRRGCSRDELPSRLGIHPYAAQKLAAQANKTDEDRLYRAVELLLQTDLDMKRGRIDPVLALETLVVALGQKKA